MKCNFYILAFKTKDDGYMIVGAGNNKLFTEICDKLGLPELVTDPRYVNNATRVANRDSLISTLSEKYVLFFSLFLIRNDINSK